jgi:vacuolar-type H+-ATPase subunit I/STV1
MRNIWLFLSGTGLTLQLLLLRALAGGAKRAFPVFFAYTVTLFLVSVVTVSALWNDDFFGSANRYYWALEAIIQILIFLVVISLIYGAMDRSEKRVLVRCALIGGALLFVCVSLYFTRDPRPGRWMTQLSRNLGFLAVILDLILWAVLIQSRRADRTLLMVSGGMGIQMAGKAIGHSLRQISRSAIVPGDMITVLSHLLCLYIWWQAFRHFDQNAPGPTIS